jgi:glycerol-3-phosphate dehydrogenase subunit C
VTTIYDPNDPTYYDETDLREELGRVFELCHGCRMCFNYCDSFPMLFNFVDSKDQQHADLTASEQDAVVDACFGCKICYVKCPYIPPHEWALDFPRLMLRAQAVRTAEHQRDLRARVTDQVLARTDLVGSINQSISGLVNPVVARPNTPIRRVMERVAGVSSQRLLPTYGKVRFSRWFKDRLPRFIATPRAKAAIFPTCFIEYMSPEIGADVTTVFESQDIVCSLPEGVKCCGAPWLHQGNVAEFTRQARANVERLDEVVRQGKDIIVAQPTCAYVVKRDYPIYVPGEQADRVSEHTFDPSEYLVNLMRKDRSMSLGSVTMDEEVVFHAACHTQAQNVGLKGRDLLKKLGLKVRVVAKCSGIDGTWGYRSENATSSRKMTQSLADQIAKTHSTTVVGDCHLANTAIDEALGVRVEHPISLARRLMGLENQPPLKGQ